MAGNWHAVAAPEDIEEDDVIQVKCEGKRYAVYNLGGEFYASSDVCTHEYACLSEGLVLDGVIECPLHQGRFDIKTGKPKGAPASVPLKTFPVKVEDGKILMKVK